MPKATIDDVAELAGVSIKTVSRVVNREPNVREQTRAGRLSASTDFRRVKEVEAIIICVPTPLTDKMEPDLSYLVETTKSISKNLRRGQLIVLESTTYPGTTEEMMLPQLQTGQLKVGEDFFLATRSIGGFVLLMSLFGTHMTAFSLLGASGEADGRHAACVEVGDQRDLVGEPEHQPVFLPEPDRRRRGTIGA